MIYAALFYGVALFTVAGAFGVAFSENIVYSAFALMATLLGAAGLYVFLLADFVAAVQLEVSNRAVGRWPALGLVGFVGVGMATALLRAPWKLGEGTAARAAGEGTTYGIGDSFLGPYLLPFELASIVLLTALVGAIVLSRKELRD